MELKEPDKTAKSFEANGKTYFIEEKIGISRFIVYQMLEVEMAYSGGFAGVMRSLKKGIEHLNKLQLVDASVELSNTMDVMRKADKDKRIPAVDLCSLFINTKDEDRTIITDQMLADKHTDFEKAGIPADFFLHLAATLMTGYKQHLNQEV